MQIKKLFSCIVVGALVHTAGSAQDLTFNEFTQAFKNGTPSLDFRLRYENALQQPLQDAKATTLRTVLGYETAEFSKAKITVELVDVASFFGQRYNPGVSDLSKPTYSLINDPRGAGLTVAQFSYQGLEKNNLILGRQYINLDDQRFIGSNDFRQYPQTFDAFSISNTMLDNLNLYYAYLTEVNTNISNGRSANGRQNLSTSLFHIDWNGYQYGNIILYVYINKNRTVLTNSHSILGFRITANQGADKDFDFNIEFARQQGKYGNPSEYTAYYVHGEISKTIDFFTGLIGLDNRSGSTTGLNQAFITPMGSNDYFNGLAQVFTTTPSQGLQDYYASIAVEHSDLNIAVIYHYFLLDKSLASKRAGQELDVSATLTLNSQLALNVAYATYNPKNGVAPKTRRIWAMLTAKLL